MANIIGSQTKLPTILYKYRDWNNLNHRRIITNKELYLAKPGSFNDPFENLMWSVPIILIQIITFVLKYHLFYINSST